MDARSKTINRLSLKLPGSHVEYDPPAANDRWGQESYTLYEMRTLTNNNRILHDATATRGNMIIMAAICYV